MKPKFEIEPEDAPAVLIDPEAYDASEQEFAVSLDQPSGQSKFVVEPELAEHSPLTAIAANVSAETSSTLTAPEVSAVASPEPEQSLLLKTASTEESGAAWRQEVAAKLNHYRARRVAKEPKFPSLRLKFESSRAESEPARYVAPEPTPQAVLIQQMIPVEEAAAVSPPIKTAKTEPGRPKIAEFLDSSARILAFPRSNMTPPWRGDELADPIIDRPRILEVQEVTPPLPALGGIHIGPVERPEERRSDFEVPLQAATISRRTAATMADAVIIGSAVGLFAYIFKALTQSAQPAQASLMAGGTLFGIFWAAYHLLLLPQSGTTPGLQIARLQLRRFDGKRVTRRIRLWRAVSAVLSAITIGLGYAWCLLDEDQLCWHDRITRTYVSPRD